MAKNFNFLALLFLLVIGAVFVVYLFAKEDLKNIGESLTGNTVKIPREGAPAKETLLLSLLVAPIDFNGQMAKLRTEGFKDNFFIADVAAIDAAGKKLTLVMSFPADGGFATEEKMIVVNCPNGGTAVLAQENMELLKENAKLFEEVKKNDLLVSYCLDSNCGSAGKECVLIKTAGNG